MLVAARRRLMRGHQSLITQARALWSSEALELTTAEFQSRFDSLYVATENPTVHWQLGGAVNDYLLAHHGSIRVPAELVSLLLNSKLIDARIIGLKLITRTSSDVLAICNAVCRALDRRSEYEQCGGLHELGVLLERFRGQGLCGHLPIPPSTPLPTGELNRRLERIESSTTDNRRESAKRLREWLAERVSTT
jgi:hypothetical protein